MIISEMEIRLRADIARLQRDMDSARQVVGNATAGMERAASAAKAALASIGAGLGLQQLAGMVDEYAKFTAQLKLATQSQREYAAAYGDVKRISTQSTQGLQETGVLYARIANGTRELGVEQSRVSAITETVNLALLVSGAAASEAASAQLQLSQAFASGTLRGEEFNAVNEAAPRLMLALADGLGVPVGALKKMAEEGQITSQIMAEVLPNALTKLRQEAQEVQTIAGALTLLRNEVMEFVGVQAQANGVVAATTSALTSLAQNLGLVTGAVAVLAGGRLVGWLSNVAGTTLNTAAANRAFLASNLEVVRSEATASAQASLLANNRLAEVRAATLAASGNVQLALTTNGLIPALGVASTATAVHETNMTRLTVAQRAASLSTAALTVGTKALNGVLALTSGPIGLLVTVLGFAAMAWSHYGDKAKEANDKARSETEKSTQEIIDGLKKQNDKIRERIELSKQAGMKDAAQQGGEAVARQASLLKQILDLQHSINVGTAGDNGSLRLIELQYQYTDLANEIERTANLQKELQGGTDAEKKQDWLAKNTQYLDKTAKIAAAIAAAKKELGTAFDADIERTIRNSFSQQDVKSAANAYTTLVTSIHEKIAANELELSGYDKLSESQQMAIKLDAAISTGKNKLSAEHVKEARALIGKIEAQEQAIEAQQRAAKWAEIEAKNDAEHYASLRASTAAIDDRIKQMEREIETYGLSASAAIDMEKAKLEAKLAAGPATYAELNALDQQIEKLEKLGKLARKKEGLDANKQAVDEMLADQQRIWGDIERTAHDTFISIFDSGKSAFDRLRDALKNGLYELLYQMTLKKWIINVGASMGATGGAVGAAQAGSALVGGANGGSGIGSAAGTVGALGSLTSGVGLLGAGGLGLQAGFGALMSGGLAGIGGAISGGMAAIGAGTASSIAAGLGTIAGALGPIALGIGAAVAIWKKLDTSGTAHTGGASSASSAGVSTIRAESLGFQHTKVSNDVNSMTAQLASGIVSILDSTALAFGKTAGYSAATAFADDTSKDGAWGALLIQKMGQTVLDWNSTRTSKWAPKEFADGEKGQAQYLAALSSSVRTALNSIGLPEWARTMLNGVASDASIEDLAKVVEQINATQSALAAMRAQLVGFSSLSDSAVSALMAASGGIDKLFANASAFYDAFYSEAEKNAAASQQIATALAAVNLQMPTSRDGFRALVEAQMKLGTQGAEAVSVLLGVAGAFAQVTPEVQAAAADLTSYRSALTDAYNAESQALQATVTRMGSFAASLRNLRENALLGSLSPLSPSQKYAEAKSQYEAVLAAARSGDEAAQGRYQDVYTAFLEASRAVYASSTGYTRDFDYAQAATEEAAKWAEAQIDVGQAQLDSLKASVSGLIEVNKSVLSVREAIQELNTAMGKNTAPLTGYAPISPGPIIAAPTRQSTTDALVGAVKALTSENARLRAEQQQQTGDIIRALQGSAEASSDKIASTVKSVSSTEYRVLPS